MDNEFTRRLAAEGLKGIARHLQAILEGQKRIEEKLDKVLLKKEPKA